MTDTPQKNYPRPYLRRAEWRSLNGPWRFAFDPHVHGEQMGWHRSTPEKYGFHRAGNGKDLTINVPFPWESPLSGVAAPEYRGAGWYEREVTIPAEWEGQRAFLNFNAVDWSARVWVNGQIAAEHDNGYLPFSIDLSEYAQAGETVTVTLRAWDIAEATTLVGKQVPHWYTYSSGIWQSVWLEPRPASHITGVRISPDVANEQAAAQVDVNVAAAGSYRLRLSSPDNSFPAVESSHSLQPGSQTVGVTFAVPEPKLWSPETPHLYDVQAELTCTEPVERVPANGAGDRATTYFGMRTVSRGSWDGKGYEYILLNGEPVYLRGALDQAFHPDGLHAYPSDKIIQGDIQLAKELGLNLLRCHIKINDPRYYYWADKLGLLIFYDMPSPELDTPSMRRTFEAALRRAIARDFNSPSIIAWIIFNETWGLTRHHTADGQRWLAEMVALTRQLDPTRLVEDNSPCRYDHVETDINSWHFYINNYFEVRRHVQRVVDETFPGSAFNYVGGEYVQKAAPLMNSEYGGIAARSGDTDISWCFKYQTTELRRHAKICGYVYTELDDIEWEHNGFVNYDRSAKEFGYDAFVPGMSVADLNAADFVGLDAPPCQTLPPGSEFRAPLFVSHWGAPIGQAVVRWQVDFVDRYGQPSTARSGEIPVNPTCFDVTSLGDLSFALPGENGLATVALWLVDGDGNVRSRNYVNVEVSAGHSAAVERNDYGHALRFRPGDFVASSWDQPSVDPSCQKFSATGSGWVEYELSLPAGVNAAQIRGLELRFEAGARAGRAKIDWPAKIQGFNYPQTEAERKTLSDVVVSLNGVEIGRAHLPDDPADARGVLSHHNWIDPGSYGYLTDASANADALAAVKAGLVAGKLLRVRFTVPAESAGGLALYGEEAGHYPVAPTLLVMGG
ncbi:MAG: hypothetical protein KF753_14350 [Caldilineaceae bacterium]|nr:hypothetical protein [Caldilineaceae bacterium]